MVALSIFSALATPRTPTRLRGLGFSGRFVATVATKLLEAAGFAALALAVADES